MRVFAVSDIHTDFKKNWSLIADLSPNEFQNDVLILAGDVADRLVTIRDTLSLLRSRFKRVFYVPGNHELWVRGDKFDSLEKFSRILELCGALEIDTRPATLAGLWVVPLLSWYEASFDVEPNGDDDGLESWGDFRFCKWPEDIGELSGHFIRMNEPDIRHYDGPVISFSHFLPRPELLPPKKNLRFKGLPRVAGSASVEDQIRRLRSVVHVFGHSHINYDCVLSGVRYVQNALAYPNERWYPRDAIKQIWDSDGPMQGLERAFGMETL